MDFQTDFQLKDVNKSFIVQFFVELLQYKPID